jgi:hypothetical protein
VRAGFTYVIRYMKNAMTANFRAKQAGAFVADIAPQREPLVSRTP